MQRPTGSEMAARVRHNLHKTFHLVRLELRQTSFGLYLGNIWLLLEPALQAGAYYFLLKVVFNLQGADATFAFFFIAITFWRSHATLVTGAPYFLMSKGQPYLEQGFGLPIAYMEAVANEFMLLAIRCLVLAAFLLIAGYTPHMAWLLVILVAIVQFAFSFAIHIWLSMVGLMFKDSARFVGHIVWLWWYMSPGLYSINRIPDWAMHIYNLNPFAYFMPTYHSIILDHVFPLAMVVPILLIAAASAAVIIYGISKMKYFSYTMAKYI